MVASLVVVVVIARIMIITPSLVLLLSLELQKLLYSTAVGGVAAVDLRILRTTIKL